MSAQELADSLNARRAGKGRWRAKCPAHDDRSPSLSIAEGRNGQILLKCHAGCTLESVRDALHLAPADLNGEGKQTGSKFGTLVAAYDYRDASGQVVYQAVRFASPKEFRQRRSDGKGGWIWNMQGVTRVPFNLPAVVRANVVLICEGEKDALNLQRAAMSFPDDGGKLSYAATCNLGGAGKWLDEYSPFLAGKKAVVFEDNDPPGREHAQRVCASVSKYAQAAHLVQLPGLAEHGDVSDYLGAHSPSELFSLVRVAPKWIPALEIPDGSVAAASKRPEGGFNLVPIGDLLSLPAVPPDYLVDGLLVRGTVSCVASKPKVGKSTFARRLCLAVARGEAFLGRMSRQGSCIYLALEERVEEISADFRAMGADGTEPISIHADAVPASAIASLIALVRDLRPALVVIDPLFRLAHVRDEKAYAEVYAALGPLIDLARETATHILVTHHAGKSLKADAIDSPLGSTAIGGAAATIVVLNKRESYRTIQTVSRFAFAMPETILDFDPETRLLSVRGTKAEADCMDVEREIVEFLKVAGEKTEPEIDKQVEGTTSFKRTALRSLVTKGKVDRAGTGKKGQPYRYSFACTD